MRFGIGARVSAKLSADVTGRALLFALVVVAARLLVASEGKRHTSVESVMEEEPAVSGATGQPGP